MLNLLKTIFLELPIAHMVQLYSRSLAVVSCLYLDI